MLTVSLLAKKRDGHELSEAEVRFLVDGYCAGDVTDYQMSAFAMAVCINGMTPGEISILTTTMLESGDRLPRVSDRPRVDKHSTGGLGDKVSLILAPLLACCDVDVPMISGRGLGRTGGTLDKLDAIPGFQTELSSQRTAEILRDVGTFIVGADQRIAPADRKLYALRDVTGTVESVALITASILSKKLAASLDALVMDVKVGSGAFMPSIQQARLLAASLMRVGQQSGLPTSVLITDMDQPLGRAVGNAIEVREAIAVLRGDGPNEVRELTVELCADVLVRVGGATDLEAARARLNRTLDEGFALERWERMVRAQGGDSSASLEVAPQSDVVAARSGFVSKVDCISIGEAVIAMGGGRRRKEDQIDARVGVSVLTRVGNEVACGQPILAVHCPPGSAVDYVERLSKAIEISEEPVHLRSIILERPEFVG